ncbi:hypothetical protein QVD17_35964 [Tagetes erecta]|uniref:Uncharacterized protein n=1 Tax=Tagetes erecta TaxID=13708 RepID=A0AAD8JTI0_TARER|nr:hypothetical protein QVD17_35964 [Tagetes erecta]
MILSALAAGTPSGVAPHGFKTRHDREPTHLRHPSLMVLKRVIASTLLDGGVFNTSTHRSFLKHCGNIPYAYTGVYIYKSYVKCKYKYTDTDTAWLCVIDQSSAKVFVSL